ncbi:MAG: RluA family pseudouridine synthase, partial [Victivallales bacterium]|nr:RluA family pseudouridine synthase [Victivallales bacterium]
MERLISSIVDSSMTGVRLDVFLSERFTYHSRNQWQNEIKNGKVRINGAIPRSSRKLHEGEEIIYAPERAEPPVDLSFQIIHEDDDILLVDKSSNLPCHPAGPYFNNTLWAELLKTRPELHFVTRLDRETSGLALIAKSAEIAARFADNRSLVNDTPVADLITMKKYLCLVFGDFPTELVAEGFLSAREETNNPNIVRKKRVFTNRLEKGIVGETARTIFRKTARFAHPVTGNPISLLDVELDTGRTHQIRATLCSLGFPVVG